MRDKDQDPCGNKLREGEKVVAVCDKKKGHRGEHENEHYAWWSDKN